MPALPSPQRDTKLSLGWLEMVPYYGAREARALRACFILSCVF